MKPTPHEALSALVALLKRCAMSEAELIGTQTCIDIIKAELDKKPPVKSE